MQQPSLFGSDPPDPADVPPGDTIAGQLAEEHVRARAVADRLPALVKCGTSSWSFPGWAGIVYSAARSQTQLARTGLREYAQHPLLTTVGIDRSYYAPIPRDDLRRYADQLPQGFRCCAKAPATVTSMVVPGGRREAPVANPDFLSPERFASEMLEAFADAFAGHCGPFIVECAPAPRGYPVDPAAFAERLDRFLEPLPREWAFAVELRDQRLLTPAYGRVLARHGAGHVYNAWSAMPAPAAQARVVDPALLPFLVVRLLLAPGTWYEEQREKFKPFNRVVEPDEAMRGEVARLIGEAVTRTQPAWLLVNNKAEGSAPLTVRAIAERVVAAAGRLPASRGVVFMMLSGSARLVVATASMGVALFTSTAFAQARIRIMPPDRATFAVGQRVDIRVEATSTGDAPPAGLRVRIDGVDVTARSIGDAGAGAPPNSTNFLLRSHTFSKAGTHIIGAVTDDGGEAKVTVQVDAWQTARAGATRAKNVILLLGDGMGAAHRTAARLLARGVTGGRPPACWPWTAPRHRAGHDPVVQLADHRLGAGHVGLRHREQGQQQSRRRLPRQHRRRHVRQSARRVPGCVPEAHAGPGFNVGLVTTADVTDATPAANAVHTAQRDASGEIAKRRSSTSARPTASPC